MSEGVAAAEPHDRDSYTLRAGSGQAFHLAAGDTIGFELSHGPQVVDFWALALARRSHLSVEHTRSIQQSLQLREGDTLYDNQRFAMLRLDQDTSPGRHDMLIAACDVPRYASLGFAGYHRNCADNFVSALYESGNYLNQLHVPAPLNLFMNISWDTGGNLSFKAPVARTGDFVTLRALRDVVAIASACPQDLVPINGELCDVKDVTVHIRRGTPQAKDA